MWPEPENGTGTLGSEKSIRSPPKELTCPSLFFCSCSQHWLQLQGKDLTLESLAGPSTSRALGWTLLLAQCRLITTPWNPICIGALKQLHGEDRVKHLAEVLTAASSIRPIKTKHRTSVSEEAYCVSSCVHKLIIVHVEKHV